MKFVVLEKFWLDPLKWAGVQGNNKTPSGCHVRLIYVMKEPVF
jgi:hypothetical protein